MGWCMGGLGACAFARRNFERMTEEEAVVHLCVARSRSGEEKRKCRRKRKAIVDPAITAIRVLGELPLGMV